QTPPSISRAALRMLFGLAIAPIWMSDPLLRPRGAPSMRLILLAAVALSGVGLALTACGAESAEAAAPVLRFTAIPDKNTQDLVAKFDPLADWLARQLGVAVEYVPSGDYEASVQMFKNGDVQLAWFGGLTSVQACAAVPGARAIVMGKE